jgi:5-hydroxyisourate hydrolase-like protein (transthyretin family)
MNKIAGKTMAHILLTASAVPATALAIELTDYTTVDSL